MPIGSLVDWLIEGAILDPLREDFGGNQWLFFVVTKSFLVVANGM